MLVPEQGQRSRTVAAAAVNQAVSMTTLDAPDVFFAT